MIWIHEQSVLNEIPDLEKIWFEKEGFFETLLVINGHVFDKKEHLKRLSIALKDHFYSVPLEEIEKSIDFHAKALKGSYRLRILVYPRTFYLRLEKQDLKDRDLKLKTYDFQNIDYPYGYKSTLYRPYLQAKDEAKKQGFDHALLLDGLNVLESDNANIYFFKEGEIFSPKSSKVLPGVMKEKIAKKKGFQELVMSKKEIVNFEAVFVSNSIIGVQSVCKIDQFRFKINKEVLNELKEICERINL